MTGILIILVTSFCFNLRAQNAIYYVCDCAPGSDPNCVAGNDANNGTNPSTPWQSIAKVQSIVNNLQSNDQILFAKGGAWVNSSLNIYNFNSTASAPIVFNSYSPSWGGTDKPILTESRSGHNLFNLADGGNADHDEGYVFKNLDLRGLGTSQWAFFAYNDADYVTIDNVDIDGFGIGVHSGGANQANNGADYENQHMVISNSKITNCSEQGFLGGGSYLIIENCYFENNGFALSIFNHNIYLSNGDNVIIRGNELYKTAVVNGLADGVSLVVHGTHDSLLIEGNYIHEDLGSTNVNAWGIGVDPGYSSTESFTHLIIRGNIIENMYNVGIGVASCQGAIIENNVIINENAAGFRAIAAPDRITSAEDIPMDSLTIRNNSIFLSNASSSTIGIELGTEGSNHIVVSNVISLDNGNGFDMNLPDINYLTVNYNFMELVGNASWGNNMSLPNWSNSRGFDVNSQVGNPMFTSIVPPFDLSPQSASLLIDNGHPNLSSSIDFNNLNRYNPDIGAHEFQTATGISDINEISDVTYYPNPFRNNLHIDFGKNIVTQISMYNILGQTVLTKKVLNKNVDISTTDFRNGIYYLRIITENKREYIVRLIRN